MAIQKQSYQIVGMRQDNLIGTNSSNKFAHEIMNLRLNTVGDYTTASWTTEEGTKLKPITWQDVDQDILNILYSSTTKENKLIPVGQAVIDNKWIVFCSQNIENPINVIFKFWYNDSDDTLLGTILYIGHLGFDVNHPLETLTYYENELIQKVYWVDGKNQPRMINVSNVKFHTGLDTQFDFVQEVSLEEKVSITKESLGSGMFPPGTVKYVLTYYNKYGQETNIVYDSPLYYPTIGDRACSPDELSGDSFTIKVSNVDLSHGFDYIRLYSIIRTTENGTPIVRIVADKPLSEVTVDAFGTSSISFVDTNTTGEIIDPTILQYVGGKVISAETLDQKDNTLFLGNIVLQEPSIKALLETKVPDDPNEETYLDKLLDNSVEFSRGKNIITRKNSDYLEVYQYTNELNETPDHLNNGNSFAIKTFKSGETYRFGIQFQNNKGNWSEVIYLGDVQNNIRIGSSESSNFCSTSVAVYSLPSLVKKFLVNNNYYKARLVCCYPNNSDRTFLAQGVIAPTVSNIKESTNHAPDRMSSWFFRPKNDQSLEGPITNAEIQSITDGDSIYNVNTDVLTFHSPEIEFDESLSTLSDRGFKLSVVGVVPISGYFSKLYVDAASPQSVYCGERGIGFVDKAEVKKNIVGNSRTHNLNPGYWVDTNVYQPLRGNYEEVWYKLHPFQRNGSLNDFMKSVNMTIVYETTPGFFSDKNQEVDIPVEESSKLRSKILSNLLSSVTSLYMSENNETDLNQSYFTVFDSLVNIPTKLGDMIYMGNVNSIAPISTTLHTYNIYNGDDDPMYPNESWSQLAERLKPNTTLKGSYYLIGESKLTELLKGNINYENSPVSSDPVPITFKSTRHGVFASNQYNNLTLPDTINIDRPYLWLAELTRDIPNDTRFGGRSNIHNVYLPCGPAYDMRVESVHLIPNPDAIAPYNPDLLVRGFEGDHYIMRYDCLKTYSYDEEDTNQIIEILSFLCETRINLDGRYDKNRGLVDNTIISNKNFNYINQSYTQSNNFFTYFTLDELSTQLNHFPNQITWTKTKIDSDKIDEWTNISLASTADADGVSGKINRIVNVNGDLMLFQNHGVSKIGYNEKTALSVEKGVPIEIANSEKYTGLTYLSKEVGCQNKWSISVTKNGVFFIDDSRQELLLFSEGFQSLSSMHGLDAFLIEQLPDSEHFSPWTPHDPRNFVTYYDKLGNDIFYINGDYCLAWNEKSKTFTSFYGYNNVPYMANIGTHLLMWQGGNDLSFDINQTTSEVQKSRTQTVTKTREVTVTVPADNEPFTDVEYLVGRWESGPSLQNLDQGMNYYRYRTLSDIKKMFARVVIQPKHYSSRDWNAHFIISLEFKKNSENFVVQLEVEGKHIESIPFEDNHWDTNNMPIVRYRVSDNVTSSELSRLKFALGGFNQPTIEIGNFSFKYMRDSQGNNFWGYSATDSNEQDLVQPWDDVSEFVSGNKTLVCVTKIYDLNKGTDDEIVGFIDQGVPFNRGIRDSSVDVISTEYEGADISSSGTVTKVVTEEYEDEETVTWTELSTVYQINDSTNNIWAARELTDSNGVPICSNFFGVQKPYWITLACDGASDESYTFPTDKVFNTIEYRADVFDRLSPTPRVPINLPVFDKIAAYNGYQVYREFPINSIRKFEIWRATLPRASYFDANGQLYTNRDRIRNPFCYIKLLNSDTSEMQNRMILHDLAVYYDMK